MVVVIWEAEFGTENAAAGSEAMRRIWVDMRLFDGYLDHEFLVDVTDPGHITVVSHWQSKEAADRIRDVYASHANALEATRLASQPRRRCVYSPIS